MVRLCAAAVDMAVEEAAVGLIRAKAQSLRVCYSSLVLHTASEFVRAVRLMLRVGLSHLVWAGDWREDIRWRQVVALGQFSLFHHIHLVDLASRTDIWCVLLHHMIVARRTSTARLCSMRVLRARLLTRS